MGNFKSNNRGGFGGRNSGNRFGGRGRFGGGRDSGRRNTEMYDAVCAKCGERCQVPFRPTGDKPVLCSNCFRQNGNFGGSRNKTVQSGESSEQLKQINAKLDKILFILQDLELDTDDGFDEEDSEDEEDEDVEDDSEEDL